MSKSVDELMAMVEKYADSRLRRSDLRSALEEVCKEADGFRAMRYVMPVINIDKLNPDVLKFLETGTWQLSTPKLATSPTSGDQSTGK